MENLVIFLLKNTLRGNLRFLRKNSLEYTSKILTGGMEFE